MPTGRTPDAVLTAAASAVSARTGGPELDVWAGCAPGTEPETAAELAALGWRQPHLPTGSSPTATTSGLAWHRGAVHGRADLAATLRTLWTARTITGVMLCLAVVDLEGGSGGSTPTGAGGGSTDAGDVSDESDEPDRRDGSDERDDRADRAELSRNHNELDRREHGGRLEQVHEVITNLDLSRMPHAAFAVRAERRGAHRFRSPELAGVAGQAIIDAVRARTGRRLPVDLEQPVTEVKVELDHQRLRVGYVLGAGFQRRPWLRAHHHAGLRPTTAAALLGYAGWTDGERLIDPLTGGGTIPIEAGLTTLRWPVRGHHTDRLQALGLQDAALSAEVRADIDATARTPRPLPIRGLELYGHHVTTARTNRSAAGLDDAIRIDQGDATRMVGVDGFDCLVTNPPYGLRAGSPRVVAPLYRALLARTAEHLAAGGRAVVLTPADATLREAAATADLTIGDERAMTLGKLDVRAFLLTHT